MNRNSNIKKELIFVAALIIMGVLFVYGWMVLYGNSPETYKDVIYEKLAMNGSNKSIERSLVYILSFIGILVIALFYNHLFHKGGEKRSFRIEKEQSIFIGIMTILFTIFGVELIVYGSINYTYLSVIVFFILIYVIDKNSILIAGILFTSFIYAIIGSYRLFVVTECTFSMNIHAVIIVSEIIMVAALLAELVLKKRILERSVLIVQLLIPFTLLIFLTSNYTYNPHLHLLQNHSKLYRHIHLYYLQYRYDHPWLKCFPDYP